MRSFDFSPLYRSTVGFDQLAKMLDRTVSRAEEGPTYPPYNIEKLSENDYRITLAIAGFGEADLSIEVEGDELTILGKREVKEEGATFLHRGIAGRDFERRFHLADHIKVTGAKLENGLLHIDLAREIPEALKPRKVEISTAPEGPAIEGKIAA